MTETSAEPRRRFRYSLRTLLVLSTLLCVWLGTWVNRAQRQRLAVENLRDPGNIVRYDYQQQGSSEPSGARWLRHWIGDDYFEDVVWVMVRPGHNDQRALANLDGLRNLRSLDIFGLPVTDDNLRAIGGLRKLEHLTIGDGRITDQGLAHLASLTRLDYLALSFNQITDDGLHAIATLKSLRVLTLSGKNISDRGLDILSRLTNLVDLQIQNSSITDAGLKSLVRMRNLKRLTLVEEFAEHVPPRITDEGLQYVVQLKNLRELTLQGQGITNAGLAHLGGLSGLRDLDICHPWPEYTEEGVALLQARLPTLAVTHSAWAPMRGKYTGALRLEARPRGAR